MVRRRIRGGHKLLGAARVLGLLDCLVEYPVGKGVSLGVPLWRGDNDWDEQDIDDYEAGLFQFLAGAVRKWDGGLTLIDCGADIGIFSAKLLALCPDIQKVIAFEPNAEVFPILRENLSRLPIPAEARAEAVGDSSGRARLERPEYDPSDHARFAVPDVLGDVPILRIDDLDLPMSGGLVLKVDVEGGELGVLTGARRTLERADRFAVTLEAHPEVTNRTCVDPLELVRFLQGLRPCQAYVSERPEIEVETGRSFRGLVPDERVYNLVVLSGAARSCRSWER